MSRRFFVVLLLGLLVTQGLSGCTWFSDEKEYAEGFEETDLVAPLVPSYPPHSVIDRPGVNESQLPPGFAYNLSWAMGEIYALWGGFIRISVENTGANDIFVYRYGIVVNWSFPSEWIYEEQNISIPIGEEAKLGLVYFSAPDTIGNYSYHVIISLLVKDNELFEQYNIESWYDNGTVHSKDKLLYVTPLEEVVDIKIIHNYKYYHDKLKDKVEFDDVNVKSLVSNLINPYPGDNNIYQVLAKVDIMLYNISYILYCTYQHKDQV